MMLLLSSWIKTQNPEFAILSKSAILKNIEKISLKLKVGNFQEKKLPPSGLPNMQKIFLYDILNSSRISWGGSISAFTKYYDPIL